MDWGAQLRAVRRSPFMRSLVQLLDRALNAPQQGPSSTEARAFLAAFLNSLALVDEGWVWDGELGLVG